MSVSYVLPIFDHTDGVHVMEPHKVKRLEAQVAHEVQTLLTEGDPNYLHSLTPAELLTALKDELYFQGVYHRDDVAAYPLVQDYLARHLPLWLAILQQRPVASPALSGVLR